MIRLLFAQYIIEIRIKVGGKLQLLLRRDVSGALNSLFVHIICILDYRACSCSRLIFGLLKNTRLLLLSNEFVGVDVLLGAEDSCRTMRVFKINLSL